MQYELFNQSGSSLKTWKELSPQSSSQTDGPTRSERPFCSMSSENWKESVTSVRGEYSARLKSAHPTNANEFSSSQGGWATPAARDYKGSYRPESLVRKDGKSRMDGLPQQAEYDPTANYGQVGLSNHPAIVGLPDRDKLNKSGKSQESSGLWATPTASAAEKPQDHKIAETENWPTASARDWKDNGTTKPNSIGKTRGFSLGQKMVETSTRGKLNPSWVEQLMGLPVGWTQLPTEWIDSDCSATE